MTKDSTQNADPKSGRSYLERFLSLFAPVRPGEGAIALLMTFNVFLLMTAYYIIKPVREALILSEWGAEAKIYAAAGQAILLLAAVPLYSRLAASMARRKLITSVLLFFSACLVGFYVLASLDVKLGIPFFLWVGVFNVMVVAQFWSFANDIYTAEGGKRLFAILGFGQSSGAVFGSFITGRLVEPLGVYQLMLLSAVLLVGSLALTRLVERRNRASVGDGQVSQAAQVADEKLDGAGGFQLVLRNKYLLLIAGMMILANLVNTTGEYVLGARVTADRQAQVPQIVQTDHLDEAAYAAAQTARDDEVGRSIGRFYADFFSIVNLVGLLMQLFLVSRIVRWIGVHRAILILPLVAIGGYALMALLPILAVARWAKTAENATDYSLQNTVRNMLFLPTTRQEKYKAKQAIDTFAMRVGDVLAALVVLAGTSVLGLTSGGFALTNVGLAVGWLILVVAIGRRFRTLSQNSFH